MRPRGLSLQQFSTSDLPASDRHEAWVNRAWPSFAPVFRTVPIEPFEAHTQSLRLGELAVHYTHITGQRWTRDRAMMRSYDPDALAVVITLAGNAHGRCGEQDFRSGPGSVQLADLSQPSDHVSTASHSLAISMPRKLAEENGLDVRALHGVMLQSGAASLLAPHLLALRRAAPGLSSEDLPQLGGTVIDLLAFAVAGGGPTRGTDRAGRQNVLALAARREIEATLGSPSLSVANLCRRLEVSRSTLHRLFEAEGGVQAHIRARRLEAARLALADAGNTEPIYAIAERLGFSDAAHLSRLFRERYGLSPRDYRVAVREAGEGGAG